jgi:hypothetical protein
MIRPSCVLATILLLAATASAQYDAHSSLQRITSPVRDGGVYHLGVGTWTRRVDTANALTQDIVYSNTCPTGYHAALLTNEYYADEGRVPGPYGPVRCDDGLRSLNRGCNCAYTISAFQIGYCTGISGGSAISLNIGFQNAYTACAVPNPLPHAPGTFDLTGLPGASSGGKVCWTITVDLQAASLTFSLNADGSSCTWSPTGDSAIHHLFGWTIQNRTAVTGVGNSFVGAMIAGNGGNPHDVPNPPCSMVDNTRWDTLTCPSEGGGPAQWPNNLSEAGFGMDTQDRFRDDTTNVTGGPTSPPSGPGCYFFGGNPVGSFYLRLFAESQCAPQPAVEVCRPGLDFTTPTCPCSPPTTPGAGCNGMSPGNAPTGGALLTSAGTTSIAGNNPGVDTMQFTVTGLPNDPSESAYLISGPFFSSPVTFGQGLLCVSIQLQRLQRHSPAPVTSTWPQSGDSAPTIQARHTQLGDPLSPGTMRYYFVQYLQSTFAAPCTTIGNFNASNAQRVTWSP